MLLDVLLLTRCLVKILFNLLERIVWFIQLHLIQKLTKTRKYRGWHSSMHIHLHKFIDTPSNSLGTVRLVNPNTSFAKSPQKASAVAPQNDAFAMHSDNDQHTPEKTE